MRLLLFGAGNIGRSFIGQLFSRGGCEVVFVDIDDGIVHALNERHRYLVEIRDEPPSEIWVENVRAVHGRDSERVAEEIATADLAATAVGANALPHVYPNLARGLSLRRERSGKPLDIILCENLRNAAGIVREGLRRQLPADYPFEQLVGLVETSIGKMVPIMGAEDRARDPLLVFAEAYNTLIVDRRGFLNPVPSVPGLEAKGNMAAYVDRKSFIHNSGHAIAAYVGYVLHPEATYMWEVLADPEVHAIAQGAMWESGEALMRRYPQEFDRENQGEHIADLLRRFQNRALGDTVYRVGRDLLRKLSPEDRLIAAMRMHVEEGVEPKHTIQGTGAALLFRKSDEQGRMFARDEEFVREWYARGVERVLTEWSKLRADDPGDKRLIAEIVAAHDSWAKRN